MECAALIIQTVQASDYEDLARFFEDNARPEITEHFHPFLLTPQTAHGIACTSHLDRYYTAIHGGRIVGLCMLRGWDEGFTTPSFGMFVDYRYHKLGFGRQLTEFAIAQARDMNCSAIRLSVHASNKRAKDLYEALGFRQISQEPIIVAGQPDLKIVMIKDLE
jgi:ribosomal protein S18 acetylase RimI-like enzyme